MNQLAYYEDLGDRLLVVNANTSKRNALSPDYYRVILQALDTASTNSRITSVILHGEGGFFCAGGDLGLLATRQGLPRAERLQKIEDLHDVIRAILTCPKPVIAAVTGGAAGAGVSLAFACDLLVADEEAKFTIAYVKAGLVPDGGLTSTLSAHLPRAMLSDQMDAERDAMAEAVVTPEAIEGINAFLEKRTPEFQRLRE